MGYVYVMSVMSAGMLGVLLLALNTEQARRAALRNALQRFPGFDSSSLVFEQGSGLALDHRQQLVCLISCHGADVRLSLVSFKDVVGCEVSRDGRRVVHAFRAGAEVHLPAVAGVELRVFTRDRRIPAHRVSVAGCSEALRWFYQMKVLLERSMKSQVHSEPAALSQPRPCAQVASVPAPVLVAEQDTYAYAQVQKCVGDWIAVHLHDKARVVVAERTLRDECGIEQDLVGFHQHMNRCRRDKAFALATLTYSRDGETWRIARRR